MKRKKIKFNIESISDDFRLVEAKVSIDVIDKKEKVDKAEMTALCLNSLAAGVYEISGITGLSVDKVLEGLKMSLDIHSVDDRIDLTKPTAQA